MMIVSLLQAKEKQLESWFVPAFQQMWWARQESNLRSKRISLRSHFVLNEPILLTVNKII